MEFRPQDFVVFNNVSEGGTCHGCSGKAFPVQVVDDEVPNLGGKIRVGCFPLHFFSSFPLFLEGRDDSGRFS